jgi:hypothetical protein
MQKMIKISAKALKETDKCTKDFSCLSSKVEDLCKLKRFINRELYFIECKDTDFCDYRKLLEDAYICTCPTRKEICNV